MKMKNKLGLKIISLVALSLLLAVNCAEKGTNPDENIPPQTFTKGYQIELAPDSATYYNATINWSASDLDGQVYWYYWRVVGDDNDSLYRYEYDITDIGDTIAVDTINLSTWQTDRGLTTTLRLNYPVFTKSYIFEVKAQDNDLAFDPTPAKDTISINRVRDFNYAPDTKILSPLDGGLCGRGIHFSVQGTDIDAAIDSMEYKIDNGTWTKIPTDILTGTVTVDTDSSDFDNGMHTIYFRSYDHFGAVDPSPATVTVMVVDTLYPDLEIVSGPIPSAYYYLPSGGTSVDINATWNGDANWYYSTLTYRTKVDSDTWTDWGSSNTVSLTELTSGDHKFYFEAKDLGGNVTSDSTDFGIGGLTGDLGILLVNGIHSVYGAERDDYYNSDAPYGNHDIDFWDVFTGGNYTNTPTLDSCYIGSGVLPGNTLGNYSSMVMIMNGYNGDLEVYASMFPLIISYLNAGGNVLLACRYGSRFIHDELEDYAHISSWAQTEVSIAGLTAVAEGLVDQIAAGASLTDLPVLPTHEDVTLLFTDMTYEAAGGILVEPSSGGKLIFIAGRPYRMDLDASKANYDYMLTNYFSEEN